MGVRRLLTYQGTDMQIYRKYENQFTE